MEIRTSWGLKVFFCWFNLHETSSCTNCHRHKIHISWGPPLCDASLWEEPLYVWLINLSNTKTFEVWYIWQYCIITWLSDQNKLKYNKNIHNLNSWPLHYRVFCFFKSPHKAKFVQCVNTIEFHFTQKKMHKFEDL